MKQFFFFLGEVVIQVYVQFVVILAQIYYFHLKTLTLEIQPTHEAVTV